MKQKIAQEDVINWKSERKYWYKKSVKASVIISPEDSEWYLHIVIFSRRFAPRFSIFLAGTYRNIPPNSWSFRGASCRDLSFSLGYICIMHTSCIFSAALRAAFLILFCWDTCDVALRAATCYLHWDICKYDEHQPYNYVVVCDVNLFHFAHIQDFTYTHLAPSARGASQGLLLVPCVQAAAWRSPLPRRVCRSVGSGFRQTRVPVFGVYFFWLN